MLKVIGVTVGLDYSELSWTKEKSIVIIQGFLKAEVDLSILLQLKEDELERSAPRRPSNVFYYTFDKDSSREFALH